MVKYLSFSEFFFYLEIPVNVNAKATVWHTPCFHLLDGVTMHYMYIVCCYRRGPFLSQGWHLIVCCACNLGRGEEKDLKWTIGFSIWLHILRNVQQVLLWIKSSFWGGTSQSISYFNYCWFELALKGLICIPTTWIRLFVVCTVPHFVADLFCSETLPGLSAKKNLRVQ